MNDCFDDGSDEEGCTEEQKEAMKTLEGLFGSDDDEDGADDSEESRDDCPASDSFACADDGHCFPLRFKCDGTLDCADGSDEGESALV